MTTGVSSTAATGLAGAKIVVGQVRAAVVAVAREVPDAALPDAVEASDAVEACAVDTISSGCCSLLVSEGGNRAEDAAADAGEEGQLF